MNERKEKKWINRIRELLKKREWDEFDHYHDTLIFESKLVDIDSSWVISFD